MKLLYTERSPFARKVRMAMVHHGLMARVELVSCPPSERSALLFPINPLGKIPALVLDNGRSIVDSPVITQYIDAIGENIKLIPSELLQRVHIHQLEALADGILDAAVLYVGEKSRPADKIWQEQCDKQLANITRTLEFLEKYADFFALPRSVAHLSAGAAIAYLYGRMPFFGMERDWLEDSPQLAAWYEHFRHEALMVETAPATGWN
jgi:glutathione S-transferase